MPEWTARRKRLASAGAALTEKGSKVHRVLAEAEGAAAAKGGGGGGARPKKQAILEQLVMIIARMCMSQARDLAELTGVLYSCNLLPLNHITAATSMDLGDEYQDMIKELGEEKEVY